VLGCQVPLPLHAQDRRQTLHLFQTQRPAVFKVHFKWLTLRCIALRIGVTLRFLPATAPAPQRDGQPGALPMQPKRRGDSNVPVQHVLQPERRRRRHLYDDVLSNSNPGFQSVRLCVEPAVGTNMLS